MGSIPFMKALKWKQWVKLWPKRWCWFPQCGKTPHLWRGRNGEMSRMSVEKFDNARLLRWSIGYGYSEDCHQHDNGTKVAK